MEKVRTNIHRNSEEYGKKSSGIKNCYRVVNTDGSFATENGFETKAEARKYRGDNQFIVRGEGHPLGESPKQYRLSKTRTSEIDESGNKIQSRLS